MIDYTELKRLAEDCKEREIDFNEVSPHQGSTSCDKLVRHYLVAASPDVVLGLIKALEHTTMAAEAEAKELDKRNAEVTRLKGHIKHIGNDALRKENHALRGVLQLALDSHGVMLTSYPPQDAWVYRDVESKARAVLKVAEQST